MNHVGNEVYMKKSNILLTSDEFKKLKLRSYPKGTVIFPKRGGAILTNKKRVLFQDSAFDLNLMGILPLEYVDNDYLFFWFQKLDLGRIYDGSNVPQINNKNVFPLKFQLSPLPEQRAIVAKIEALFSELDSGIQNLKTAQAQLKIYRQAVLKKAFEGGFTNDDVREGELPKGWSVKRVGEICDCIVPNRDKPKTFTGDIPWITTPDLQEESINIEYSKIDKGLSKEEAVAYKAKVIPVNSVIMTCVGNFGVTAIVEFESVINQQLHAFLPSDKVLPKYLAYSLKTQKVYMNTVSTSITIAYLNKKNCNSVPINIPASIKEQTQIVQEIESRLSVCDKMEESITESLLKAEALRQSILKKAFEGKLLSEAELSACRKEADWEPAGKLVERVRNKNKTAKE